MTVDSQNRALASIKLKRIKLKNKINFTALGFFLFMLLADLFVLAGNSKLLLPHVKANTLPYLDKLPDFSKINDVNAKKKLFFNTLYPIIKAENLDVLKTRKTIVKLQKTPANKLSAAQLTLLTSIATEYKLKDKTIDSRLFTQLLIKVDYVPPSLVLTQAAIESGWGTSRFAREGNNLFGQWCFSKGCGMVPSSRDSGKAHQVAKFSTVNHSVRSYIRNINTNKAYIGLRKKRALLRKEYQSFSGIELAKTLTSYSEEGQQYVNKLTNLIRQNKLQRYTQQFEQFIMESKK